MKRTKEVKEIIEMITKQMHEIFDADRSRPNVAFKAALGALGKLRNDIQNQFPDDAKMVEKEN